MYLHTIHVCKDENGFMFQSPIVVVNNVFYCFIQWLLKCTNVLHMSVRMYVI